MNAIEFKKSMGGQALYPARVDGNTPAAENLPRPGTKFGVILLCIYMFLLVGRVLDLSPLAFLHVPMILLILLGLVAIFSGGLRDAFSSRIAWFFAAFTGWVVVCFPLSQWRAASLDTVQESLQAFLIFFVIFQILRTEADWRRAAGTVAYALLVASLLSFYMGQIVEGRLALVNGTLGDPNEFALTLVIGLAFWSYKANRAGGIKRILFLACTVPIFIALARTGSRSGLLALAALFLALMLFGSVTHKVLMVIVAAIVVIGAAAFLPGYLKARYLTFFSPQNTEQLDRKSQEQLGSDIDSSEGRKNMLLQSIQMTFEHPIFGVGPGVFAYAAWDERKKTGGAAGWALVTHNTYTQISSETGIPGFLLFVAALFLCLKYTVSDFRATRSLDRSSRSKEGLYLFACVFAFAVGMFFLSLGYGSLLPVIFGLAASLHRIVRVSLKDRPVESLVASSSGPAGQTTTTASHPPFVAPRLSPAPLSRPQRRIRRNTSADPRIRTSR